MSDILKRETYASYEGAGGWADGRLGAAYDLVQQAVGHLTGKASAAFKALEAIEALDDLIGSIEQ